MQSTDSCYFIKLITLAIRLVSVSIHFTGMYCSKNGSRYMQGQRQKWKHGLDDFLQVKGGKRRRDRNWLHLIPLCILYYFVWPVILPCRNPPEFGHIQCFVRPM